ncbi:MAG: hypothetical protein ACTS47_00955 [Candidatus Hodgkinia cicadicola]
MTPLRSSLLGDNNIFINISQTIVIEFRRPLNDVSTKLPFEPSSCV